MAPAVPQILITGTDDADLTDSAVQSASEHGDIIGPRVNSSSAIIPSDEPPSPSTGLAEGTSDELCANCVQAGVWQTIIEPIGPSPRFVSVLSAGVVGSIRSSFSCPFCRLLANLIPHSFQPHLAIKVRMVVKDQKSISFEVSCATLSPDTSIKLGNLTVEGNPWKRHTTLRKHLCLRDQPDSNWSQGDKLDFGHIKERIAQCEARGCLDRYAASPRYSNAIDVLLVDVVEMRLVQSSSRARYIAFSYVWGDQPGFKLTSDMRTSLEMQDGLKAVIPKIPTVVQDAIALTEKLGERYLWIDALCIEQDNASQKHALIAQMDIIYRHSLVCAVALAAQSAWSSLPGVRAGTLRPAMHKECIGHDIVYTVPNLQVDFLLPHCKYETRGWTFQERLLSPRCLIFTNYTAFYDCEDRTHLDAEQDFMIYMRDVYQFENSVAELSDVGWSENFELYTSLVAKYTTRHLSQKTDVLHAFFGILSTLGPSPIRQTICGLPEPMLDLALLWIPIKAQERNSSFSSWSWAGWTGPAKYTDGLLPGRSQSAASIGLLRHFIARTESPSFRVEIKAVEHFYKTPRRHLVRDLESMQKTSRGNLPRDRTLLELSTQRPGGIDVLAFTTETVVGWTFRLGRSPFSELQAEMYTFAVHGDRGPDVRCGLAWGNYDDLPGSYHVRTLTDNASHGSDNPNQTIWILLSRSWAADKAASTRRIFDPGSWPWRPWCVLNVMLIQLHGSEPAERVAIAQVHEDAWKAYSPVRRYVELG